MPTRTGLLPRLSTLNPSSVLLPRLFPPALQAGLRQSIKQAVTESRALEHFSQADKRSTKTLQTQLNSELA
jgi:hypothetical protein